MRRRTEAVKCRWCGSFVVAPANVRGRTRTRDGKTIPGVRAGIAREIRVPGTALRRAFVLGTLFGGGIGIVRYVVRRVGMRWQPSYGLPARRDGFAGRPYQADSDLR